MHDPELRIAPRAGSTFVVLPAKNEADEIEGCLLALAAQEGATIDGVVLCVNNTSDDTVGRAQGLSNQLPFHLHVLDVDLPPPQALASVARRIAADKAVELAGPNGVLLMTDADSRAPVDWVRVNLTALARGAEAVAGQAIIEPIGARLIPAHLHAIDARECAYAALLDEIASLVDPDPFDPWPRHEEHSGASIAVTVEAYRRAGGIPQVTLAEDRAFFEALRRVDARIRHDPAAQTIVSARVVGRAPGGMADTIRRRIDRVDPLLDDRLEPAADSLRRVRLRAQLRTLRSNGARQDTDVHQLGRQLALEQELLRAALSRQYFGAAWCEVEAASPILQRRRVALSDLSGEFARARRIRDLLRAQALRPAADPADTPRSAAAD